MPSMRAQDAQCAICMDSLFDARDDLDEVLPIATPDCGHVFHEKCVGDWFKSQATAYVNMMRDRGDDDASPLEAPAECPECRTECFADELTGNPLLHRLFINFGDDSAGPSSSAPPQSTPARRRSQQSTAVLGAARIARTLAREFDDFSADTMEVDVEGARRRTEQLRNDANELSKNVDGLRTYIHKLTGALDQFGLRLRGHPLIPTLLSQCVAHERTNAELQGTIEDLERRHLPRLIKQAVEEQRTKTKASIAKIEKERDSIKREYEKEKVKRGNQKRAMEEREESWRKQVADVNDALEKQKADSSELATTLSERTRLLKNLQQRSDTRKELKSKLAEVEAENERLRGLLASVDPRGDEDSPGTDVDDDSFAHGDDDNDLDRNDLDESEGGELWDILAGRGRQVGDESLVVVDAPMSDFDFDAAGPSRAAGRSTTSRTFRFDMDEGRVSDGNKKSKSKGTSREKERDKPSARPKESGSTSRSKYFARDSLAVPSGRRFEDADRSIDSIILLDPPVSPERAPKRQRTNMSQPTASRRSDILVEASSPIDPASTPPRPRQPEPVVFDLTGSSPVDTAPPYESEGVVSSSPTRPRGHAAPLGQSSSSRLNRQFSVSSLLVDSSGRLKKNLVIGAKVRRRA